MVVLTGRQVEAVNEHFNRWLELLNERFKVAAGLMRNDTLNERERLETLELIQSIYRSYLTTLSPIYNSLKWRRMLNRHDAGRTNGAFAINDEP